MDIMWHFIAVTRDGTEAILYMDGAMDNSMTYVFPVTSGDLHGYAEYNEWNFFAATRDGQFVKFFMQGDLLDTQAYTVIPQNPGNLLRLGAKPFKGALDDVRIYRTALPDEQIRALYEDALAPDIQQRRQNAYRNSSLHHERRKNRIGRCLASYEPTTNNQ